MKSYKELLAEKMEMREGLVLKVLNNADIIFDDLEDRLFKEMKRFIEDEKNSISEIEEHQRNAFQKLNNFAAMLNSKDFFSYELTNQIVKDILFDKDKRP